MPIQSITNRRIYQQIADQLRAMISSGEFPPGSYLPAERELSQMFGVSRTSVREALIALEVVGLVKVRVGDGVTVQAPGAVPAQAAGHLLDEAARRQPWPVDEELGLAPDFAAEVPPFSLLQARRLVEPEAAALAAEHASKSELAGIEKAYRRNIADNRAGSTTHPGDRLLHIRIADASGNPAYALLIRHLLGHQYGAMFQRLQALYTPRDMPHRSELEHRAIVESLQARDAQAARRAMRAHLDSVIRIFSRAAPATKASAKAR
jgi:DNA-binding FadR family transcriptional regulator